MTTELKIHLESSGLEDHLSVSNKQYEKPVLVSYGDVRDITLGPTLGTTESGCAGVFRPGAGIPPGTCPPGGNG